MAGLKTYLLHLLIALDQVATALVGGFPDETLSSYAYRMEQQGKPGGVCRRLIDALFGPRHCQQAHQAEKERRQMPPELRGATPGSN